MVLVLSSCDRNSCFITPEYHGNEDCSMCVDINRDEILSMVGSAAANVTESVRTHCSQTQFPDIKSQYRRLPFSNS